MAKPQTNKLSIVVPTYTGEETIQDCLKSIFNQEDSESFEVVVVIDGPNDRLRQTVEGFTPKNKKLIVHQSSQNQGRFEARKTGAQLASGKTLLFVDDRVRLALNFIQVLKNSNKNVMLANIIEANHPTFISRALYLLRRRIYGANKWGAGAKSFMIDLENFDKSPKGTTGLWVSRGVFLEACALICKESRGSDTKNISDDTKLLRHILNGEGGIYKCAEAKAYYYPRSSLKKELHHLYQRGPKFVDYYFMRGSRYQPFIVAALLGFALAAMGLVIWGLIFLVAFAALTMLCLMAAALLLMERVSDILVILAGVPIIVLVFGAGAVRGISALKLT